jgi:Flp pilus assembly protein TadD
MKTSETELPRPGKVDFQPSMLSTLMENPNRNGRLSGWWRVRHFIAASALIVLTLIPYWQTESFGFINFDDPLYVQNNPLLADGLTWKSVVSCVFGFHEANWHPLVWLSYMLEVELFGVNPGVMHITNVVLHIMNSLLVYFWFSRSTGDGLRSFLAALLFAIHPMHVESVAWITERKDVLSTLFLFASVIAYSEAVRKNSRRWYLTSLVLFCLGLSAKSMLVTLPVVLMLLDVWPLRRIDLESAFRFDRLTWRQWTRNKILFLIPSFAVAVLTVLSQRSGGAVAGTALFSPWERISNSMVSVSRYMWKCIWPANLSVFYPMPTEGWPFAIFLMCSIVFVSISVIAWKARGRNAAIITGWCWFVVTLMPVIGIIQVGIQAMADRYSYVPMVGLSIVLFWGLPNNCLRLRPANVVVIGLITTVLVYLSVRQVSYWSDSITLFSHALAIEPANNYTSHQNLGNAYAAAGQNEEAIDHFQEAAKIYPTDSRLAEVLATSLMQEGKYREAEELLVQAIRFNSRKSTLWLSLGNINRKLGEAEKAMISYSKAVALDPTSSEALNNLGLLLSRTDNSKGMNYFRMAIKANPANAQAHNSLGNALVREGQLAEAEECYTEAIRLADLAESKKNLAYVREQLGQQSTPK